MNAPVGIDFFLDRNFLLGAGLEPPANANVHALRVFAKHDEVHILRPAAFQRTEPLVQQLDRSIVDEQIEFEPRTKQNVACVPIVRDARIPQRADEDRVESAQQVVAVRRNRDASLEIVVRAPRQLLELEGTAESLADGFDDFDGFGGDVFANAVAGNDGNAQRLT